MNSTIRSFQATPALVVITASIEGVGTSDFVPTGKKIKYNFVHGGHRTSEELVEHELVLDGEVRVEINLSDIVRFLGAKALCSKGGKAVEYSGLVKATRTTKRVVSDTAKAVRPLSEHEEYV